MDTYSQQRQYPRPRMLGFLFSSSRLFFSSRRRERTETPVGEGNNSSWGRRVPVYRGASLVVQEGDRRAWESSIDGIESLPPWPPCWATRLLGIDGNGDKQDQEGEYPE